MAAELMNVKTNDLVAMIGGNILGDILKPLVREICLFDTYAAGVMSLKDKTVLDEIRPGEKVSLLRCADPLYEQFGEIMNEYAIMIIGENGKLIGYIPEKDDMILARLMDAGKALSAKIKRIEKEDGFTDVQIAISMMDF